jgi:hypothetical protein
MPPEASPPVTGRAPARNRRIPRPPIVNLPIRETETSKCLKRLAFEMLAQALHTCQGSLPTCRSLAMPWPSSQVGAVHKAGRRCLKRSALDKLNRCYEVVWRLRGQQSRHQRLSHLSPVHADRRERWVEQF